jgi:hypothetical protein
LTGGFLFIIFVKNKDMYVIVKHVRVNSNNRSKKVPVILLNSDTEVWEFETKEAAEEMKDIFQTNSDSGHVYEVKKI